MRSVSDFKLVAKRVGFLLKILKTGLLGVLDDIFDFEMRSVSGFKLVANRVGFLLKSAYFRV